MWITNLSLVATNSQPKADCLFEVENRQEFLITEQ